MPDLENYVDSLKYMMLSGAYVSRALMAGLAKRTGAQIVECYGSTEVGAVTELVYQEGMEVLEGDLGSILPTGFEIAFFSDKLEMLEGATEGVLGVKNYLTDTTTAYEGVDDATNNRSFINGYNITGDIVKRVGNNLFFLGRSKNIINIGGNKFSLEASENSNSGFLVSVVWPPSKKTDSDSRSCGSITLGTRNLTVRTLGAY